MGRIWLAVRVFFRTLFDATVVPAVREALDGPAAAASAALESPVPAAPAPARPAAPPKAPARSDAVTLLATLQREARFIDFVKEDLSGYSDAQVGAVARDIHRDCGKVLDRLFALRPLVEDEEGSAIELPKGFDAGRFRLTGKVTGEPPFRGRLVHPGWEAGSCDVPAWTGSAAAARAVAPAEVELG